jgi:hypothetical protein
MDLSLSNRRRARKLSRPAFTPLSESASEQAEMPGQSVLVEVAATNVPANSITRIKSFDILVVF